MAISWNFVSMPGALGFRGALAEVKVCTLTLCVVVALPTREHGARLVHLGVSAPERGRSRDSHTLGAGAANAGLPPWGLRLRFVEPCAQKECEMVTTEKGWCCVRCFLQRAAPAGPLSTFTFGS